MFSAERTIFAELYCGERLRKGVGTRSHISFLVRSVVLARADEVTEAATAAPRCIVGTPTYPGLDSPIS
jgi:hypothetical protein